MCRHEIEAEKSEEGGNDGGTPNIELPLVGSPEEAAAPSMGATRVNSDGGDGENASGLDDDDGEEEDDEASSATPSISSLPPLLNNENSSSEEDSMSSSLEDEDNNEEEEEEHDSARRTSIPIRLNENGEIPLGTTFGDLENANPSSSSSSSMQQALWSAFALDISRSADPSVGRVMHVIAPGTAGDEEMLRGPGGTGRVAGRVWIGEGQGGPGQDRARRGEAGRGGAVP